MNEQELIHELNHVENERAMWKATAIKCGFEMVELKAQVNCLRESLKNAARAPNHTWYYAQEALEATPEHCLAEVKAKAIEDSMPKIINACVKCSVEKYINTSVEMVSVGQLKHLSEIRHHGEWEQAK